MTNNCLFCKIINGEIPADKLYEDDEVLAFRDINPVTPVHFLVIPKKHLVGPAALTVDDDALIGKMIRTGNKVAREEGIEDYRIAINNGKKAGQEIFHLHMHVIGGRDLTWPPG